MSLMMCVHTCAPVHIHVHTCIHGIHTHTTHTHTHTHTHTCTHAHAHTHTYMHTHTHTRTHTHSHNASGADLSVCTTTSRQCCLQSYIESAMMIANNKLNQELRYQLRDTSSTFNNTVNSIYGCKFSFICFSQD